MVHLELNRFLACMVLAVILGGCDSGPTYQYEVRPGQILDLSVSGREDAWVTINGVRVAGSEHPQNPVQPGPVVVRAGVPFSVETITFAGGCWEAAVPSVITTDGQMATVAVFDKWISSPDAWCNAIQTFEPRTDRVTFREPGEAEVVIRGQYANIRATSVEERYVEYELRFPVVVR